MSVRNLDRMFSATRLLVLGETASEMHRCLLQNLQRHHGLDPAAYRTGEPDVALIAAVSAVDLVVVLDPAWGTPEVIAALGAKDCRALLWACDAPPTAAALHAAKPFNLRVLGPRSAGLFDAAKRLNATTLPLHPGRGHVALIAQSQSVAAAVVDWAVGRNIGLSWLAVTGAEADIDVADLLDHAALDPNTRAVIVQVGCIRNGRKFMSAARAAARTKPVLILQTAVTDASHRADPVKSAAFRRAGLVECESLGGLFDGLAALELLASPGGDRVAVVANGAGVCALASSAVLAHGLTVAEVSAPARLAIAGVAAGVRYAGGGIDIGNASAESLVSITRALLSDPGVDVVMIAHSPLAGEGQRAIAATLSKAALGDRVLTVWLGLHTASSARHSSAQARLATFNSVGDAARAIRYRLQHARTRELLMRTPPADRRRAHDAAHDELAETALQWVRDGTLIDDAAQIALDAYGLRMALHSEQRPDFIVCAGLHEEFGMWINISQSATRVAGLTAYGLPPLDALLAQRLIEETGYDVVANPAIAEALRSLLVRISQLVVDRPSVVSLVLPLVATADGKLQRVAGLTLGLSAAAQAQREHFALAPYPQALAHPTQTRNGRCYQVRPVRPADEPALLALLERLDPEEVRLRFFVHIRRFTHDMAARMTQIDYDRELTLIAFAEGVDEVAAGIATIIADADGQEAEYAVLVHHDHARQGLGRHLLECLLREAGVRGIGMIKGDVLADNAPMLRLVRNLGFTIKADVDDPSCRRVELRLPVAKAQA